MKGKFPISGTFIDEITYDIPCLNWTKEQWIADIDNMREVGIDTLIFIRGGFKGRTIYPSEHFYFYGSYDFLDFILQEADKRDMKVFVGLYISNLTWNDGNYQEELKQNRLFIDEVYEKYKNHKSFYGWYLPHEVESNSLNICPLTKGLASMCKEKDASKKILMSPFFRNDENGLKEFSIERLYNEWDYMFSKFGKLIDYCAFQDGSAKLSSMVGYFAKMEEVCKKYDIELWANTETFERDVRKQFYPIPFDLLRAKIDMLTPYVKKFITFEFSHFLSPQSIYLSARNLNNLYKNYYGNK